jgi:hypothetical protein
LRRACITFLGRSSVSESQGVLDSGGPKSFENSMAYGIKKAGILANPTTEH